MKKKSFATQEDLYALFGFTAEDLAANKNGQLTQAQKERKRSEFFASTIGNGIFLVGMLILLVFLMIAGGNSSRAVTGILCLVTLALVGIMWVVVFRYADYQGFLDDLSKPLLLNVCGRLTLREDARDRTFLVDGKAFPITAKQAGQLRQEAEYCVYYLENSHYLVALELVENYFLPEDET